MAIVISDTSPIRAFNHLGLLHLLPAIFTEVHVPPAVAKELQQPSERFAPLEIGLFPGFGITAPQSLQAVEPLREGLHGGEYEAIALALETSNLLLIDEAIGRRVAMKLGVRITGVLGILLTAKNQRLVEQIRPLINRLRTEIDFHLSDQIVRKTLVAAGE